MQSKRLKDFIYNALTNVDYSKTKYNNNGYYIDNLLNNTFSISYYGKVLTVKSTYEEALEYLLNIVIGK